MPKKVLKYNTFNINIIVTNGSRSLTKIGTINSYNSVGVMIQISDEFLQTIETAYTTLKSTGSTSITFFLSSLPPEETTYEHKLFS